MRAAMLALAIVLTIAPGPREYDAARAVEAPPDTVDTDVAAPDQDAQSEALPPVDSAPPTPRLPYVRVETTGGTSAAAPSRTIFEAGTLPRERAVAVPRILTTISGFYPGEEAKFRARGRFVSFSPGLQVRTRVGAVSEFTVDELGNDYSEGAFIGGRVRWRPVLGLGKADKFKLVGMLDIANGRWAPRSSGDPIIQEIIDDGQPPVALPLRIVDPRELYIEYTTRIGQFRLGQMSFTWGQGLLVNDGNNMDRFGDLKFGNDGDGSIQERILFATKPLARSGGPGRDVIFAIGADLIFRDPNANLLDGDLAGQGIFVVRYQPEHRPGTWLGGYAAYRRQRDDDDGDVYEGDDLLEVGAFDFAGQGYHYLHDELALIGAFETVAIVGRTTFPRGDFSEYQVLQGAAALRAYVGDPLRWLAGFDAGWASGDANPEDQEVNNFQAAPGYTAGLLLFQYYAGWQSARSQIQAEDEELSGVPANGTQYLPTEGQVTNAVYIQPKARYGLWERFEVWGGPLFATSAVPVIDPYASQIGGGASTNSLGGLAERRYLGTELDLGIRGRYGLKNVWVQAGLQGGILFPGRAFVDAGGGRDAPIFGGWFRAEIRY